MTSIPPQSHDNYNLLYNYHPKQITTAKLTKQTASINQTN